MPESVADGRVVLVTGASGGIGRAICERFGAAGASVVGWDVDPPDETAKQPCVAVDITDGDQVRQAAERIGDELGRIDILVNAAGIIRKQPIDELNLDAWNRVLAVNVTGALRVIRACLPLVRRAAGPSIVNIGSMTAHGAIEGYAPYSASKAALVNLTQVLALELASEGVRVNSISPGWVRTPMVVGGLIPHVARLHGETLDQAWNRILDLIPTGRLTEPEEIAYLVETLTHPLARSVTGADFAVDGGIRIDLAPGSHRARSEQAGMNVADV